MGIITIIIIIAVIGHEQASLAAWKPPKFIKLHQMTAAGQICFLCFSEGGAGATPEEGCLYMCKTEQKIPFPPFKAPQHSIDERPRAIIENLRIRVCVCVRFCSKCAPSRNWPLLHHRTHRQETGSPTFRWWLVFAWPRPRRFHDSSAVRLH